MTVAALTLAVWLALQIPIGMALGCYIRRAQTLEHCFAKRPTQRSKRRALSASRAPAVLLGR